VIVNYNAGRLILDCVESICRFTRDYELLVVDNGSTDNSVEELTKIHPNASIIRNHVNLGFANANNIGIRNSRGKYVVLLNPDAVVTENWLEKLTDCMTNDPQIGIATPKLLKFDGSLDSTGHVFRMIRLEAKNRGEGEQDQGQYDALTELLSCDFACSAIRREMIAQIGFLDERIFLDHEDLDYCLRAKIAGWRVVFCPASIVYHDRGKLTVSAEKRRRRLRARRYMIRLSLKNYGLRSLSQVLVYKQRELISLVVNLLSSLKSGKTSESRRSLDELGALVEALFWNATHFPIRERVIVQQTRRVSDEELKLTAAGMLPWPNSGSL
jgi:GT2 family glycosyltransferase